MRAKCNTLSNASHRISRLRRRRRHHRFSGNLLGQEPHQSSQHGARDVHGRLLPLPSLLCEDILLVSAPVLAATAFGDGPVAAIRIAEWRVAGGRGCGWLYATPIRMAATTDVQLLIVCRNQATVVLGGDNDGGIVVQVPERSGLCLAPL